MPWMIYAGIELITESTYMERMFQCLKTNIVAARIKRNLDYGVLTK